VQAQSTTNQSIISKGWNSFLLNYINFRMSIYDFDM